MVKTDQTPRVCYFFRSSRQRFSATPKSIFSEKKVPRLGTPRLGPTQQIAKWRDAGEGERIIAPRTPVKARLY
jgi:hypothetical protein